MERLRPARRQGSEPGSGPTTCPTCHGRGEILYQQSFLSIRRTCSTCNGSGQIIRNPCSQCRGQGYRQVQREAEDQHPGRRGRRHAAAACSTKASPARRAVPGDLYVFLKVKEHAFFERRENDLHCTIPINVAQAALGARSRCPPWRASTRTSRGHPDRGAVPAAPQRRGGAQLEQPRRPLRPRPGQDSAQADTRAAQALRAVAGHPARGQPAQAKRPLSTNEI